MPSLNVNKKCEHPNVFTEDHQVGHQSHIKATAIMSDKDETQAHESLTVSKMLTTAHGLVKGVTESYSFQRHMTSEVVIFDL